MFSYKFCTVVLYLNLGGTFFYAENDIMTAIYFLAASLFLYVVRNTLLP